MKVRADSLDSSSTNSQFTEQIQISVLAVQTRNNMECKMLKKNISSNRVRETKYRYEALRWAIKEIRHILFKEKEI